MRIFILLTRAKSFPEFHLKQLVFTYSACETFTKHHGRIQKFRETSSLKHLYGNKLSKSCFDYAAKYSDSKYSDLAKRTISEKILKNETYEIARNYTYDEY